MLTDDYIAGLFDGEGCVILQIHNDKRGKGHSYLEPKYVSPRAIKKY